MFFNDRATTEIYTLSLHDALPIWLGHRHGADRAAHAGRRDLAGARPGLRSIQRRVQPEVPGGRAGHGRQRAAAARPARSEEHTSELQSRQYLVCRLLLEKQIVLLM